MLDELVKRLRYCSEEHSGCGVCELSGECVLRAGLLLQAADAIEDLEFACNRYEKDYKDLCAYLPRWIPVTERLPEEMETVLVTDGKNVGWSFCVIDYGTMEFYSAWKITHWMPFPSPPMEDN